MHGVAERTRTCAACVWRMRAASLCVALCAMHSSSSYQPSPPPIRVLLRPALYQPSAQPSAHSPPPIVLSAPQPSAPTTCPQPGTASRAALLHVLLPSPNYTRPQHQAHPVTTGLGLPQLLPGIELGS